MIFNPFPSFTSSFTFTEKKKTNDKASELHNDLLEIYFDEYNDLTVAKRKNLNSKYDPVNLFLETYYYENWFENEEESTDKEN